MKRVVSCVILLAAVTGGCCCNRQAGLSDSALKQDASAWPLEVSEGIVFTDNDAAFRNKLAMVQKAKESIDLAYGTYSDDYSSSLLTKALVGAACRNVAVRLLVDYGANYGNLDYFLMMEKEGKGNLRVRFYNRPTANIVRDAVFMTMGCSGKEAAPPSSACSSGRFAAIDTLFADERIAGLPAAGRNISNLEVGKSGLFLSGLYGKRSDVVALAALAEREKDGRAPESGRYDIAAEREKLREMGRSKHEIEGDPLFQRLSADAGLFLAFSRDGVQPAPFGEAFASILPPSRPIGDGEARDWEHFADAARHRLLLVDHREIQVGSRDVKDSDQMHPNPLLGSTAITGIDLFASLARGGDGVARSFDELWNFTPMVATLAEVYQHAPNDYLANLELADKACSALKNKPGHDECVAGRQKTTVYNVLERMGLRYEVTGKNAGIYITRYLPKIAPEKEAGLPLDKTSTLAYLENLPFDKGLPAEKRQRIYDAVAGRESADGKYLNDTLLKAIPAVCAAASPANPKRVVLRSARFLPPANLTYELSRMVNGELDCANVRVTVLTNPADASPANLVARHAMKAFSDFYREHGDPARRAAFDYYEYRPAAQGDDLPLQGTVAVLGDDVLIGSADADVRSLMTDSSNALLVRNAPAFVRAYQGFVDGIIADPARVKKMNDYFTATPHETMVREDMAAFRQLASRIDAGGKADGEGAKKEEERFVRMLNDAYGLTRSSIAIGSTARERRESQDRFNREFEHI